jgi:hypothetical protein
MKIFVKAKDSLQNLRVGNNLRLRLISLSRNKVGQSETT